MAEILAPAGGPFTAWERDRARRACDAAREALMAQVPGGFWLAIRLESGRTDGKAYPTKQAAIDHQPGIRADSCAYLTLPHDGIIEWRGVAAFLRMASSKASYWRANPDLHLHVPTAPIVDGTGYAQE